MPCYDCSQTKNTSPPYANDDDIQVLSNRTLNKTCVGTVAGGTLPANFCALAFAGSPNPCCDILYVVEGTTLWASQDCANWYAVGGTQLEDMYLLHEITNIELDQEQTYLGVNNIPQDGTELIIKAQLAAHNVTTNQQVNLIMNNLMSTGAYYTRSNLYSGAGALAVANVPAGSAHCCDAVPESLSNTFTDLLVYFRTYTGGITYRVYSNIHGNFFSNTGADKYGYSTMWVTLGGDVTNIYLEMATPSIKFATGSTFKVYVRKRKKVIVI